MGSIEGETFEFPKKPMRGTRGRDSQSSSHRLVEATACA